MNKTYKEVMRQLAEKGVNFEDLAERLNDCHDSCSAKEIEDKLTNLINHQPRFTLTQEEVEIVKHNLICVFESDKEEVDKILTRIKQWQDEQN